MFCVGSGQQSCGDSGHSSLYSFAEGDGSLPTKADALTSRTKWSSGDGNLPVKKPEHLNTTPTKPLAGDGSLPIKKPEHLNTTSTKPLAGDGGLPIKKPEHLNTTPTKPLAGDGEKKADGLAIQQIPPVGFSAQASNCHALCGKLNNVP